jgi:hypothetical protein
MPTIQKTLFDVKEIAPHILEQVTNTLKMGRSHSIQTNGGTTSLTNPGGLSIPQNLGGAPIANLDIIRSVSNII